MTYDASAGEHRKVLLDNLPGGSGGVAVEDEGTQILASAARMNFTGAGVNVTDAGGSEVTIAITGGTASGPYDLNGNILTIDTDGDSTLYEQADDAIRISTGGSDRLEIGTDRLVFLGGLDLDLDENYVRAYHTYKYNNVSGAQTLSRANYESGATVCHSGAAATYTVPSRIGTSPTTESEQLLIRNRGSGTITLSASGVTIKGNTSVAADESAGLEWETDGTTEYVWVDGGS